MYIVGARPNFMKVAPVIAAAERWNAQPDLGVHFERVLVHTGQHYDELLSDVFFRQLGLPEPDESLGIGSGSHAQQTARMLEALEPVICRYEPDAVLVPGDVNSTCAGALVAAKLNVPVVHIEAGLRSGDRSMPEEVNRIVADHLSDLLLTTCADGDDNLLHEGVPPERIVDIGNTMIDSLLRLHSQAEATVPATRTRLGVGEGPLVLATLHRPSNVDEPEQLLQLLGMLGEVSAAVPVVFPMHLRTRARLAELDAGAAPRASSAPLGRAARVSRVPGADDGGSRGRHRLRWRAGGDDLSGCSLRHRAHYDGAARDRHGGHQQAGRPARSGGDPGRRARRHCIGSCRACAGRAALGRACRRPGC